MLLFLTKANPPVASSTVLSFALAERVASVQRIAIDRNDPIIDPPGNLISAPTLLRGDERTSDNSRVSNAMTMPVIDKLRAPQ
jgi:hypothetical protein